LWFDLQPERAIECWEKSAALDAGFPTVQRNLGWAYYRAKNDIAKATAAYERAIACDAPDARLFYELDSLYEFGNAAPERRLAALERNHAIVAQRQDSLLREIMVLVLAGRHEQAIEYLTTHRFHAREGSEGIRDVYVDAFLLRGLELLRAGDDGQALEHFQKAGEFPENLAVGRSRNDPRLAQIAFLTGQAKEALGQADEAAKSYARAWEQKGTSDWPEARFYQAQAAIKLGKSDEAQKIFAALATAGQSRLKDEGAADFFAKFGEQETKKTRAALGHFLLGLSALGQGRTDAGRGELEQAVKLNASHVWASYWLAELKQK
jgi:tetratricopeptide (TPR) repeat protein